jgi:aristolochene synthase
MSVVLPPTPPSSGDFGSPLKLHSPAQCKGPVYWQRFHPLPLPSLVQVPPSIWTAACHPRVDAVSKQVNDWFLAHWDFPGDKARARFVAAGFPRVTCLYYPLAKDDRIHFACELLTILFLIDGELTKES